MEQGKHLNEEGIQSIINIRSSLNLGLSEVQIENFPNTVPVIRPSVLLTNIPHPQWMAGFITAEGCFFISLNKNRNKVGIGFHLVFQVSQHIRDEALLKSFTDFFKCGYYVKPLNQEWGLFLTHGVCTKFSDNFNIIIPSPLGLVKNTLLEVQNLKIF